MNNYYLLILIFFGINLNAQNDLTIREVFDFEVGDEFQYRNVGGNIPGNYPPNADRLKVIDKYYSTSNDTLFYVFSQNSYYTVFLTESPYFMKVFNSDTIIESYTSLDSSIFSYDEMVIGDTIYKWKDFDWFSYDSTHKIASYFCNVELNGFTCSDNDFEPNVYFKEYGKGIGILRDARIDSPSPYIWYDNQLFYCKKGTFICGTPDLTTSIHKIDFEYEISIFPNPANKELKVNFINSCLNNSTIKIFNSIGKLFLVSQVKESNTVLDISNLIDGIYYIQINSQNIFLTREFIKN